MAYDIGTLLFVDFLGMTDYPGGVFSTYPNLFQQIIMFLIVPTIFIIMILYIMTGRIIPDRKLRVMLGVGAYLFIVAGRYYSFFAYLSGPYFIFLIFVLGVLGYVIGHFRVHDRVGGGGTYSRGGGYSRGDGGGHTATRLRAGFDTEHRGEIREDIEKLHRTIAKIEREKDNLEKKRTVALDRNQDRTVAQLDALISQKDEAVRERESQIEDLEDQLRMFPRHRL